MPKNIDQRAETGLWKDSLANKEVESIARRIKQVYQKFDEPGFIKFVLTKKYFSLELKERIGAIADGLYKYLPSKYKQAVAIIKKTTPHLGEFENWCLLTYIEKFGLDYFDESVSAMKELTKHSTAEFAIRPFMIRYTDNMMPILNRWAENSNEHIRRLAAEGSRPRGVWVAHVDAFKKDPTPVLKLLEKLKADESLYVRKAVANNLNDISKEHPDAVIKTCKRWKKDNNIHTDWVIKRACRSLIKQGNSDALAIFGFTSNPKIKIEKIKFQNNIKIGNSIKFSFEIISEIKQKQNLAVDYKISYLKKNGNYNQKVFKLLEKELLIDNCLKISHKQSFANMSTRKHYPGKHSFEIIVNGKTFYKTDFQLGNTN